jgi:hypothetical protein
MSRAPIGAEPSGLELREHINARNKTLFDAAHFRLTSVGGTADAVTATLAPALDGGGLVDGMTFGITWGAANTAGVTLAINGGSAVAVLDRSGAALPSSAISSGLRSLIEYIGGNFRVLTATGVDSAAAMRNSQTFTASGTWTPPVGADASTPVYVEAWGAGGGGSTGRCGGGGGYAAQWFRIGDLGSSVTVTIGAGGTAGGATGGNGANSTFGAFLTAYGGGGSAAGSLGPGGFGGGSSTAGTPTEAGRVGGGWGGAGNSDPAIGNSGLDASNNHGGGGGARGTSGTRNGGWAVYGGGGGGQTSGGKSKYGGDGGSGTSAGSAPGGGGGATAAGARGEVRVWI